MYRIYCYVLIVFITICPSVCESATVNYNIGGYAIEIKDLVIGSDHYNVIFEHGTFESIFTAPPDTPFFWGSATQALDAVNAINSVLNDEDPIPDIIRDENLMAYYVPYEYVNLTPGPYWVSCKSGNRSTVNPYDTNGDTSGEWPDDELYYAKINAVPLPGTVLLLCSGLAGLLGLKRKFKK